MHRAALTLALSALLVLPVAARAEDPAPAPGADAPKAEAKPEPRLATAEELAPVLEQWAEDCKEARRLKDDERTMQYDLAMDRLTAIQHPKVVAELASLTRHPNEYVRLLAVMYLGRQTLMPSLVGEPVADFMRRHKRDDVALMSGLETLGTVGYLGARSQVAECLAHREFVVKKYAMECVGLLRDMRLLEVMLKQVGVDAKAALDGGSGSEKQGQGGKETEGEAVSWEGVDVTYDTGTAGDHDQQMAEKIGKAQQAKNEAEARAKAGAAGGGDAGPAGGGGGGGSGSAPRGGSARSQEELIPAVLRALKRLTGEEFSGPRDVKKWLAANRDLVAEKRKQLDELEKQQSAEKKHFK